MQNEESSFDSPWKQKGVGLELDSNYPALPSLLAIRNTPVNQMAHDHRVVRVHVGRQYAMSI